MGSAKRILEVNMFSNIELNAYPTLHLHDCVICDCYYDDDSVTFCFNNGIYLNTNAKSQGLAEIMLNDVSINDICFLKIKPIRIIKGLMPVYHVKHVNVIQILKMIRKGYLLRIENEYYDGNNMVWRGSILFAKNKQYKLKGYFEIEIMSSHELNRVYKYNL